MHLHMLFPLDFNLPILHVKTFGTAYASGESTPAVPFRMPPILIAEHQATL